MSDNFTNRMLSGNFQASRDEWGKEIRRTRKRRLVEECVEVSIRDVRKTFGTKVLTTAIRQARPVRLPVLGGSFDLWLIDQLHRLPGRPERWSSLETHNCRLWLQCWGCQRVVGKLYYFYVAPDSLALSDLLCRKCHGLVYQSQNCGGNRWYREIARPLKRLLREKRKLVTMKQTPRIAARLARIEGEIRTLRKTGALKTQPQKEKLPFRPGFGERRPYRDLGLLENF